MSRNANTELGVEFYCLLASLAWLVSFATGNGVLIVIRNGLTVLTFATFWIKALYRDSHPTTQCAACQKYKEQLTREHLNAQTLADENVPKLRLGEDRIRELERKCEQLKKELSTKSIALEKLSQKKQRTAEQAALAALNEF
jgi:hypothetical protein